jgi:predicted Zn-dependent protease
MRRWSVVPLVPLAFALGLAGPAGPAAANAQKKTKTNGKQEAKKDARLVVRDALEAELARAMKKLKMGGFDAPYFLSYVVREYDAVDVYGRFGALVSDDRNRSRQAYVEVRVGDYQFDNTADAGDEEWNPALDELYEPTNEVPIDDDADAMRATLWLLTDTRYKAALAALHQKRGHRATKVVEDESLPSFAKAPVVVHVDPATPLKVDRAAWQKRAREASAIFKKHEHIFDNAVRLQATREIRTIVNSEGSRIVTDRTIFAVHVSAISRADDGALLDHGRSWYGATETELPDRATLLAAVEQIARELDALRKAPVLDPYTGPAILMEEATGVLFHEVIGHRLEGERLGSESEGQTFKGQIGQQVVPSFLDVVDDPTTRTEGKLSLNGWYRHDDEGVAAERVALIDDGVLKAYLTSRRPVAGVKAQSNGHGRAEGAQDPMARMGTLIVRSTRMVTQDKLKKMLLDEVRRQGKPFGLMIRDITGGSTNTASYGYQAFKGTPRLVYKIDAKTGEETLVRGVEMVGTPLTSINKILATSDTIGVFNGYCGAESGYVPVSTIAPAVLMSEIELQRQQQTKQRSTVIPAPWIEEKK